MPTVQPTAPAVSPFGVHIINDCTMIQSAFFGIQCSILSVCTAITKDYKPRTAEDRGSAA